MRSLKSAALVLGLGVISYAIPSVAPAKADVITVCRDRNGDVSWPRGRNTGKCPRGQLAFKMERVLGQGQDFSDFADPEDTDLCTPLASFRRGTYVLCLGIVSVPEAIDENVSRRCEVWFDIAGDRILFKEGPEMFAPTNGDETIANVELGEMNEPDGEAHNAAELVIVTENGFVLQIDLELLYWPSRTESCFALGYAEGRFHIR